MKKSAVKHFIFLTAIIVLLVFLHFTGILSPVERGVYFVFNKVAVKFYSVGFYFRSKNESKLEKKELLEKIGSLEEKIKRLTEKNARLEKLEEENSKLRQNLRFFEESKIDFVLANVISRQIFTRPEENLPGIVIDKGSDDGLFSGLAVVDKGIVIGKIVKTEKKASHIIFITDSDCRFGAAIYNSAKTIGATAGNLGLTVNMDFIPQVEKIEIGDLVVTSGLEKNVPRGLVIGEISKIDSASNEMWQSASIEPLADFNNLTIVSVLLP